MGNGIGKLNLCFAGDAGEISRRRHHDIAVYLSDPLDEGFGHSFCYIRPDPSSKLHSLDSTKTTPFPTISGASISANTSTPLSTALIDLCPYRNFSLDKAASFESSDSFASIPLQPIPRNSLPSVRSGPIPSGSGSGPIERGFLSGPIERSFISCPMENQYDQLQRYKPKSKKFALMRILKRTLEKSKESNWVKGKEHNHENSAESIGCNRLSCQVSLGDEGDEDDEDESIANQNVQWAQGKAGEDRVHVVISEEHGWDFVGIYDGFNGPDATDFLLNNLYANVFKELKGILWNENTKPDSFSVRKDEFDLSQRRYLKRNGSENSRNRINSCGVNHSDVLKALWEALRKTEEAYLEIADMMLEENPELALMGSCVLAMLMKGDNVYLMNVGDSRAVLARKPESFDGDEFDAFPRLDTCQLSIDHSTSVEEEVRRIKSEHWDDASAIMNDRVKGSLKVTRAFGAGFLKQPKWNNALLEMFRINYVGTSPYITCFPQFITIDSAQETNS